MTGSQFHQDKNHQISPTIYQYERRNKSHRSIDWSIDAYDPSYSRGQEQNMQHSDILNEWSSLIRCSSSMIKISELGFVTQFSKKILTNNNTSLYCPYHASGGMAEWFNAAVLKTAVPQGTQSSNLCPSAIIYLKSPEFFRGFFIEKGTLLCYHIEWTWSFWEISEEIYDISTIETASKWIGCTSSNPVSR